MASAFAAGLGAFEIERIGDQREPLGDPVDQWTAGPHADSDVRMSAFHLPPQRLDEAQFTTGADPVLDRGQQSTRRDDRHRAQQQRGRRTDADQIRGRLGAHRADEDERAGRDDEGDTSGEKEQRPPTAA